MPKGFPGIPRDQRVIVSELLTPTVPIFHQRNSQVALREDNAQFFHLKKVVLYTKI